MKTYNSPMLQVVSINKCDIIISSTDAPISGSQSNEKALAPGMRGFDDYYEGY